MLREEGLFQGGPEAASLKHCKEQALRWEEYHGTAPSPFRWQAGDRRAAEPAEPGTGEPGTGGAPLTLETVFSVRGGSSKTSY